MIKLSGQAQFYLALILGLAGGGLAFYCAFWMQTAWARWESEAASRAEQAKPEAPAPKTDPDSKDSATAQPQTSATPESVVIAPKDINLSYVKINDPSYKGQRIRALLTVTNRTEEPIYEVFLKVVIESPTLTAEQLVFHLPPAIQGESNPAAILPGVPEVRWMRGKDVEGKKAYLFSISALSPKRVFTLGMVGNYEPPDPATGDHKALVTLLSFQKQPPELTAHEEGGALKFWLPEKFTVEHMGVLTRPTSADD